jgi:serine/threonine protein kinase
MSAVSVGVDLRDPPLGPTIAEGAAGTIHRVIGSQDFLAKIYKGKNNLKEYEEKIDAMLLYRPDLPLFSNQGKTYVQIAWPEAKVVRRGHFVGFIMKEVNLQASTTLSNMLQKSTRKFNGLPEYYGARVHLALNLALLMVELHTLGHYMIDMKPQNIRFYPGPFYLAILDTDGFSINGSRRFPARMYSDEFIAPEAQGLKPEQLGLEQDLFALSIIIFQLLNNGVHPFQGVDPPSASYPTTLQERIYSRLYPYGVVPIKPTRPVPSSIHECLEDDTCKLFDRAFLTTTSRPSAQEWSVHLNELRNRLRPCNQEPKEHAQFSKGCGFCALESRKSRRLSTTQIPAPPPPSGPSQIGSTRLPTWFSRRLGVALIAACAVILVAIISNLPSPDTNPPPSHPPSQGLPSPGPAPQQLPSPAPSPQPQPVPPASPDRPGARLEGPADNVWDAATISMNGRLLHLSGVRSEGAAFTAEMRDYLKGERLSCIKIIDEYQCSILGTAIDIAEHALVWGWVKLGFGQVPKSYQHAQEYAQLQNRGLWRSSTPDTMSPVSSAFRDGLADRQVWEQWFSAQTGDYREGASYWSGQRSLPKPGGCNVTGRSLSFVNGCAAAKSKLDPTDTRRKSDPEYRLGWNSYSELPPNRPPDPETPTPSPEVPSPSPTQIRWYPNMDAPGNDLGGPDGWIRDVAVPDDCMRRCLTDRMCVGVTYDIRHSACFPKSRIAPLVAANGSATTGIVTDRSAPPPTSDPTPRVHPYPEMDAPGGDRGERIYGVSSKSCESTCVADPGCAGYTYKPNPSTCALKSFIGGLAPAAEPTITGIVEGRNVSGR